MDLSKQPWEVQQQVKELQRTLMDWREGRMPVDAHIDRIIRIIEHLTLQCLISEDEQHGNA